MLKFSIFRFIYKEKRSNLTLFTSKYNYYYFTFLFVSENSLKIIKLALYWKAKSKYQHILKNKFDLNKCLTILKFIIF